MSDKKIPKLAGSSLQYFNPDVKAYNDYYPGGMLLPGRHANTSDYRYGINGMELDNELKGEGNSYDYGERFYDPRIVRWMSKDKIKKPWLSQYQFASNNPINNVDPDGKDEIHFYYYITQSWNSEGEIVHQLHLATEVIENDQEHTFFMHNASKETFNDKFHKTTQFYPFDEYRLPNTNSKTASEANLPLADNITYAYFFSSSLDDHAYLGTLLNYAPELDDHYSKKPQDVMRFLGAKKRAASAKLTQDLATAQEYAYEIVGGYQLLKTGGKFLLKSKFVQQELSKTTLKLGKENVKAINSRLNSYTHIFNKPEHALDDLVKQYGGRNEAFDAVQEAANNALKQGKLKPNKKGILPGGDNGHIIDVGGNNVRLIGGKVDGDKVILSSFSQKGL